MRSFNAGTVYFTYIVISLTVFQLMLENISCDHNCEEDTNIYSTIDINLHCILKKCEKCRFGCDLCYNACHLTSPYSLFMYINSRPLNFKLSIHKANDLINMVSPTIWQIHIYILTARGRNIRSPRSDFQ